MTKKNASVKLFRKENQDESKIYFKKVLSPAIRQRISEFGFRIELK